MLLLADSSLEHDPISKLELDEAKEDVKMEPVEVYKEGMVVPPREDGRPPEPPEGFTIHTTESGVMVLRRKRQRNLQKLGKMEAACCCYSLQVLVNDIGPQEVLGIGKMRQCCKMCLEEVFWFAVGTELEKSCRCTWYLACVIVNCASVIVL
jgi:hypothetical protein